MALCRALSFGLKEIFRAKKGILVRLPGYHFPKISLNQQRDFRKAYASFLKTMKHRRKLAGPGQFLKRSDQAEWNYAAELYAFNKRLRENLSDEDLRCVFVHDSYVEMEKKSRKELDVADVPLDLKSNSALASSGQDVASAFVKRYLRHSYPLVPEDGVSVVHDYLLSDEVLSYVSTNLGTVDLIFTAEYPPSSKTLADTLRAVIGAIASSDSVKRAECFVLDFVCTQLIGKDVFEIWEFDHPLDILDGILKKQNREPSEPRLIFESGRNTIEAIYNVGLYSGKQLLGKGFGETLDIARDMAAYDALRRMFGLTESIKPIVLGNAAKQLDISSMPEHKTLSDVSESVSIAKNVSSV